MSMRGRTVVRGITAILLLFLLAGLASLAVYRALKKRPSQIEMDADQVLGGDLGDAIGVFTEFKYSERVKGQLIFALEALRTLGLSSGWHDIEGVSVQLYNDDESKGPNLTCRKARFNVDSKDARLNGSIHVEFPDGSFLSTEVGLLRGGGREFETGTSVTFVGKGVLGQAGSARYDVVDEILELGGGVIVQTGAGSSLVAPQIIYRRNGEVLVLPQGGRMLFGFASLEAPYCEVFLEEGGGLPYAVSFRGGVEVHAVDSQTGQVVDMWSERLRCERDASDRWHLEAAAQGPWVRVSIIGGETALAQLMKAWTIKAVTDHTGLLNLRADGRVCVESIPYQGPPRTGAAHAVNLWFNNGQASDLEFQKDVEITEADLTATAHRARIDGQSGQVMLHGNPTGNKRVAIESNRGRLTADQGVFFHEIGEADFRGRVQGELFDVKLVGGRQNSQGQPDSVHVACDRLTMPGDGKSYDLRGNARVWQGQRLIVGDEIRYWPSLKKMEASGHTKTAFPASLVDPNSSTANDVVLVARHMTFDETLGKAIYRGGVIYSDPQHQMSASELEIVFNQENEVESVIATGSVEIESFETGQKLTGSRAVRDLTTRVVLLTGEPAQATDPDGNMLSGQSLTWDQAGDRVLVSEDTETIFHPEDEP